MSPAGSSTRVVGAAVMMAAGLAQLFLGTGEPEWGFRSPNYGDDPRDTHWISQGTSCFELSCLGR